MNFSSRKDTGDSGEDAVAAFLKSRGYRILGRNIARKTGELDIVARKGDTLHFVEVKTLTCHEFPDPRSRKDEYDPSMNLHAYKVHKVARTAEWYVAEKDWEGEWQLDGALVWMRTRDKATQIEYLPQIL